MHPVQASDPPIWPSNLPNVLQSSATSRQTGEGHPVLDSTPRFKALIGTAISRSLWFFFMLLQSTTASFQCPNWCTSENSGSVRLTFGWDQFDKVNLSLIHSSTISGYRVLFQLTVWVHLTVWCNLTASGRLRRNDESTSTLWHFSKFFSQASGKIFQLILVPFQLGIKLGILQHVQVVFASLHTYFATLHISNICLLHKVNV